MKSHLQSYPCPLQINSFWNLGFLLGITIFLQIITGIFLGLHYTSDLNSAYSSVFFFIREIYYGWCLRYLHSSGASFVFLFLFLHLGRAISYGSYFYHPNTWFSGIILFFFLMATAFMGYVLPFGQMSFWGATVITNLLSPFPCLIESTWQESAQRPWRAWTYSTKRSKLISLKVFWSQSSILWKVYSSFHRNPEKWMMESWNRPKIGKAFRCSGWLLTNHSFGLTARFSSSSSCRFFWEFHFL